MRRKDRFQWGRGGVFTCSICNRRTRITDQGNDHLCPECWELAGWENTVLDGGPVSAVAEERDRLLAKAIKQGSDGEKIKGAMRTLFPKEEGK